MAARRISSLFKSSPKIQLSGSASMEEGKSKSLGHKVVSLLLMTVTGGVALSALDDLLIYRSCSSKAIEKASKNKAIIDAMGEPIARGPWYDASLSLAHNRNSLSCTFPVSGPQGSGIFRMKAVRKQDNSWSSFFQSRDWEILVMDALLHVPTDEDKQKTVRISLSDSSPAPAYNPFTHYRKSQEPGNPAPAYNPHTHQHKPQEPENPGKKK